MLLLKWFFAAAAIVLLGAIAVKARRSHRRRRLLAAPFPEQWKRILEANVELYRRLPVDLKEQLHRNINVFIGEKRFEGCGGLVRGPRPRIPRGRGRRVVGRVVEQRRGRAGMGRREAREPRQGPGQ